MFYLGRHRITTVFYSCFIAIFLGSFILLTTLSTSENRPKKETKKLLVGEKLPLIDKIRQAALSRRKSFEPARTKTCQLLHFIPDADTRPVTALVSFPGSGNTWLRHLIQEATDRTMRFCELYQPIFTGILTGSQYVDKVLQRRGFPGEPVFNSSVAVVKTHEWGPKIRERFQKAILLIRNPRQAIQSLYNLWRGGGHVGWAHKKVYEREQGEDWKRFFNGYIKDWQSMNLDWIRNFTGPLHIVLYDQLRNDLGPTVRSVVEFLDLPLDEAALQCTVEHSEGLYHRRPRPDNYDPYTDEMKKRVIEVEEYVIKEMETYLKTIPASSYVSLFRYMDKFGPKALNG